MEKSTQKHVGLDGYIESPEKVRAYFLSWGLWNRKGTKSQTALVFLFLFPLLSLILWTFFSVAKMSGSTCNVCKSTGVTWRIWEAAFYRPQKPAKLFIIINWWAIWWKFYPLRVNFKQMTSIERKWNYTRPATKMRLINPDIAIIWAWPNCDSNSTCNSWLWNFFFRFKKNDRMTLNIIWLLGFTSWRGKIGTC